MVVTTLASFAWADGQQRLDWRRSVATPTIRSGTIAPRTPESATAFWASADLGGQVSALFAGEGSSLADETPVLPANWPIVTTNDAGQGWSSSGGYSLEVIRWPVGDVPPPLSLGEPGVFGASAPTPNLGGEFTGTNGSDPRFAFPPTYTSGDSGPDPGITPVPLPAAAWSGLMALPAIAGAGWVRRRRQHRPVD